MDSCASGSSDPAIDLDVDRIRRDFPILRQQIHGYELSYLDSAASSQTPQAVIDAVQDFYQRDYSNVHRGVHLLSVRATRAYEQARETVTRWFNAASSAEVIFTRGTTEAINLVASSYGRANLRAGDEILISHMEHHSNIVPWQLLCEQTGAVLRVAPINDAGELCIDQFEQLLGPRTKIVSLVHVSNALGTLNPVQRLVAAAHKVGAVVLVDGAQAAPHARVDVQHLDCDFYAASAHKLYGPTGIGVLYGKRALLSQMPPYQGGGDMISSVTFERTTYAELPSKFEAGTPNISGAIGFAAAIDYVEGVGLDRVAAHEARLLAYADARLAEIPGLRFIGRARERVGVVSFVIEGIHPHDVGTILDHQGVAIRAGHHCAQPVMDRYGVPATVRASLGMYNTREEIDRLVQGLYRAKELFS